MHRAPKGGSHARGARSAGRGQRMSAADGGGAVTISAMVSPIAPMPSRTSVPRGVVMPIGRAASRLVDRVAPRHLLGLFHRLDIEIDDDGLVVASYQHTFERFARTGVDLLVGNERRHIDEIARSGLGSEFQPFAPAHACFAPHNVDDALELAVVMRAGLGIGLNAHRARPDFLRADARIIDRGLTVHARRLRCIGIKRVPGNDAHAVVLPFGRVLVVGLAIHAAPTARVWRRLQNAWLLRRPGTTLWPCRRTPAAPTWDWSRPRCRRPPAHTSRRP